MSTLIFDCETSTKKDGEIIEAAWLRIAVVDDLDTIPENLLVERTLVQRFRPERPMSFGALSVHHILPHELVAHPPASTFRLPDDCEYLIGHSIDYDWTAAGSPANVKRICTLAISKVLWPDVEGHSLVACIYRILGATAETRRLVRDAHSALADVMLNRILLTHLLQAKPEITTWSALWEYSEECRIPLTCPMKKYEGVPLAELDRGFVNWCLMQPWFEEQYPYFKKGLLRILEKDRQEQLAAARAMQGAADDDGEEDDIAW